jgi:hypothetical protein
MGLVFQIKTGVWNPTDNTWSYQAGTSDYAYGVDHRYVTGTYPDAGARGLFMKMLSDTYDNIYECVSLDCPPLGTSN